MRHMSTMAEELSKTYEQHREKKKPMTDYGEQLSKVFRRGRIRRMFPFLSS